MTFKKLFAKNNKGFSLVEIIVSIAALGLICAVLLRLFVVAGDTNGAAADTQGAELHASTAIETIVTAVTIEEGVQALELEYDASKKEYEYSREDYQAVLDITDVGGDYPGTLYEITVSVSFEDDVLSSITTKKYEKGGAND